MPLYKSQDLCGNVVTNNQTQSRPLNWLIKKVLFIAYGYSFTTMDSTTVARSGSQLPYRGWISNT